MRGDEWDLSCSRSRFCWDSSPLDRQFRYFVHLGPDRKGTPELKKGSKGVGMIVRPVVGPKLLETLSNAKNTICQLHFCMK